MNAVPHILPSASPASIPLRGALDHGQKGEKSNGYLHGHLWGLQFYGPVGHRGSLNYVSSKATRATSGKAANSFANFVCKV